LKKVGLALGGGIARGMAHVGVLSVLERAGIPIDCVTGSSAGSLAGALYCAGLGPAELSQALAAFGWGLIARPAFSRRGLLSFDRMERWLAATIGDVSFADLRRPLAVVVTDLETGQPVVLREGRVAPAVRASCSMPGVVVPITIDGRTCVDGCVANSVPAAEARALGAEYVIGVNLFGTGDHQPGNALTTGLAALEHLLRFSGGGLAAADCVISPELSWGNYVSFGRHEEMVASGARAAEAQLASIQVALGCTQPGPA
jgi:NTE family protein